MYHHDHLKGYYHRREAGPHDGDNQIKLEVEVAAARGARDTFFFSYFFLDDESYVLTIFARRSIQIGSGSV